MQRRALYPLLVMIAALFFGWAGLQSPAAPAQDAAVKAESADAKTADAAKVDAKAEVPAKAADKATGAEASPPSSTIVPATGDPAASDAGPKAELVSPIKTKKTSMWEDYGTWVLLLLVLALPVAAAVFLGKQLRMQEYTWKIWLVLFTFSLAVVFIATGKIGLGIDLRGGAILIYEVDRTDLKADQNIDLDKLIQAVAKRINPGGLQEIVLRKAGNEQIEIIIPGVDEEEAKRIERKITDTGKLEFRILANRFDHPAAIKAADGPESIVRDENGEELARWVPIALHDKTKQLRFMPRELNAVRTSPAGELEVLAVPDPYNVTGEDLANSFLDQDERGLPAVGFAFRAEGSYRFAQLTGENSPVTKTGQQYKRSLGVILDRHLYSAPDINSRISGRGIIQGDFTTDEVQDIVSILNAGSLPAALKKEPLSRLITGPTLGEDTINKGTRAMMFSMAAVLAFMMVYYRFSGIVACIVLVLNILYVVGLMIFFNAVFTLPGIAGLVLTVGMAVDANVLIYERMREELARGAALRMAIRNGFDRATTTIIDANLTTLITATVLYWIGTDQIKGFAVTLWLGIVLSMFTAIFVARLFFDIAERKRWVQELKMMKLLTQTRFEFLKYGRQAITASLVVIGLGLVFVFLRGKNVLDIDFTGGTSVQLLFSKDLPVDQLPSIGEVRKLVLDGNGPDAPGLPDVVVKNLKIGDEHERLRYSIDTSLDKIEDVETRLQNIFPGKLAHNELTSSKEVTGADAVPPPKGASKEAAAAKPTFELKFAQAIDHATLIDAFDREFKANKLGDAASNIVLSTAGYEQGSREAFDAWTTRFNLPAEQAKAVIANLGKALANNAHFPSSNTIGGQVADATQWQALYAILASLVGIIFYLWYRFHHAMFGVAAVVAVVHDVLVTLGALAASYYLAPFLGFLGVDPFKINLTIVAAFLTIIGYSLNDTIVIFDRIREIRGKSPALTQEMIDRSINETLSRTILTTLTTLLVVVTLYFGGGEALRAFSFALLVGLFAGTYSTVYVASPVLLWLHRSGAPFMGGQATDRKETASAAR